MNYKASLKFNILTILLMLLASSIFAMQKDIVSFADFRQNDSNLIIENIAFIKSRYFAKISDVGVEWQGKPICYIQEINFANQKQVFQVIYGSEKEFSDECKRLLRKNWQIVSSIDYVEKGLFVLGGGTVRRDDHRLVINYLPIYWHQMSTTTALQYPEIFEQKGTGFKIDFKNAPKQFSVMKDGNENIFNTEELRDFALECVRSQFPSNYFAD